MMKMHCEIYEYVYNLVTSDDRSKIIGYIERFCICGLLTSIGLLLFDFDALVVLGLWLMLILTSPWGRSFRKAVLPLIRYISEKFNKTVDLVFDKTADFINFENQKQYPITKEFYIYQYERWWVGQNWLEAQSKKWSDQSWNADIFPKNDPPSGWTWMEPWKIVVSSTTDQNGYEYANDFDKKFKSEKTLKTIRRRKWHRKCQMIQK